MTDDDEVRRVTDQAARLLEALSGLSGLHALLDPDHTEDPTTSARNGTDGHVHHGFAESGFEPGSEPGLGTTSGSGSLAQLFAAGFSGSECRICPICRLISAVRQLRPEVVEHLVGAGEELLAAAREFTRTEQNRAAVVTEPPAAPRAEASAQSSDADVRPHPDAGGPRAEGAHREQGPVVGHGSDVGPGPDGEPGPDVEPGPDGEAAGRPTIAPTLPPTIAPAPPQTPYAADVQARRHRVQRIEVTD